MVERAKELKGEPKETQEKEVSRLHTVRPRATLSLGILKHSVARNSVTGGLYVFSEG